jgi:hypothetical protein
MGVPDKRGIPAGILVVEEMDRGGNQPATDVRNGHALCKRGDRCGGVLTFGELAAFRDRLSTGVGGFILALRASSCWMTTRRFVRSLMGKSQGKRGPRGRRGMVQSFICDRTSQPLEFVLVFLCEFPCGKGSPLLACQTSIQGSSRGTHRNGDEKE